MKKELVLKRIIFKKLVFIDIPVYGVNSLARHLKMDRSELSNILNGKRIVSEHKAMNIIARIRELQSPDPSTYQLPKVTPKKKK